MVGPRLSGPEEILPVCEEVKGAELKIDEKLDGRLRLVTGWKGVGTNDWGFLT